MHDASIYIPDKNETCQLNIANKLMCILNYIIRQETNGYNRQY